MSDKPVLISVNDAANQLGIGRTRFYELLNSGEIEAVRLGARRLIVRESLLSFVDRLRTQRAF